jgi:hypothetical protein
VPKRRVDLVEPDDVPSYVSENEPSDTRLQAELLEWARKCWKDGQPLEELPTIDELLDDDE